MTGPISGLAYRLARSNARLRDDARSNGVELNRLRQENAALKVWLQHAQRDVSLALEMSDNEIEIRRTLYGLHRLDHHPEVKQ